jgi:hypothetical protein
VSALISTLAGTGSPGYSGDGGQAILARLTNPSGVLLDDSATTHIGDTGNSRVRKVTSGGTISNLALGDQGASGQATARVNIYAVAQLGHGVRRATHRCEAVGSAQACERTP